MSLSKLTEAIGLSDEISRRSFFKRATIVGATGAVAMSGLVTLASALDRETTDRSGDSDIKSNTLKGSDREILVAAEIAEALAVTTYTNIINIAPFFARIPP